MGDEVQDDEMQRKRESAEKLEAIRKTTERAFPSGDTADLLPEIKRGRQG